MSRTSKFNINSTVCARDGVTCEVRRGYRCTDTVDMVLSGAEVSRVNREKCMFAMLSTPIYSNGFAYMVESFCTNGR